jgi:hypothetical protein
MDSPDSNKRLKQQIEALRSNNHRAILETLGELRSEGDVSVLPDLFNLMLIQDKEIVDEICALLNDLKDEDAAEILAKAIANPEYEEIRTQLVAACWQNGLAYGKHLSTFAEVVVSGNYSTSLEAFTVIEGAVGELGQRERAQVAASLKTKIPKVADQKRPLLVELVKVIESYD